MPVQLTFWEIVVIIGVSISIRYALIAGGAYLGFWKLARQWSLRNRLQKKEFRTQDIRREIAYSVGSLLIYALVFSFPFIGWVRPHTRIYDHVSDYGWGWWIVSIILMALINDAYFYWMHRAVHHPRLFRWVHKVHHQSTNPTPFAAFAFHPLEAFLEFAWFLPLFFLMPLHVEATIVFSILSLVMNVIGHLGVEIYPDHWCDHPVLGWLNRSTFHNDHHRLFKGNYGLYFTFWDRVMGTLDERSRPATLKAQVPRTVLARRTLGSESHL